MRIYNKMIENENSDNSKKKSKTKDSEAGTANTSKHKSKGRPKSVDLKKENDSKRKSTDDTNVETDYSSKSDYKDLDELRETNQRLQQFVDKYRKERSDVINTANGIQQKDKTSVMQILELMKLNAYLISHLPNSELLLNEYLATKSEKSIISDRSVVTSVSSICKTKQSTSKPFKSPLVVNPISDGFKSADKTNGENSNDCRGSQRKGRKTYASSDSDSDDRSLIKRMKTPNMTKIKPKKKQNDSESDEENDKLETHSRRVSPRKTQKQNNNIESETEGVSKDQDKSTTSRDRSETRTKEKPKRKDSTEKPKPKRKRRPRVEEPKGLFPCTFDSRQCDEIMDTKEHYDFHMSGHYDAKYVCPFCAYTGPTIQIIKRHINKERETALQDEKDGKYLNADKRAHKTIKVYQCFGCKVCDKVHDKLENRCQHIREDNENQCQFMHDMDYEFKDHLKMHFADKFNAMKDKDQRKQKIKAIIDKFVGEQYFENNAKKGLLVEQFNKTKETKRKSSDSEEEEDNEKNDDKQKKSSEQSDSDWD